jgi:hypothetical protein
MTLTPQEALELLIGDVADLDQRVVDALPDLLEAAITRGATLGKTDGESAVSLQCPVAGAVVSVLLLFTGRWKCIEMNAPRAGRGTEVATRAERALLKALPQKGGKIGDGPSFTLDALVLKDSQVALIEVFDEIAEASFDSSMGYKSGLPRYPWTVEDLRALRKVVHADSLALMGHLAMVSPDRMSLSELSPVVGRSARSLAALLGAFTGMVRARFGRENWPFSVVKEDTGWVYWMEPSQGDAWIASGGSNGPG